MAFVATFSSPSQLPSSISQHRTYYSFCPQTLFQIFRCTKPTTASLPPPNSSSRQRKPHSNNQLTGPYIILPLSIISFCTSYAALPLLSTLFSLYDPSTALITGAFMPITGILFATFATTAVSVLHNRQINLRSALTTELANIRLLQCLLSDSNLRQSLRNYLKALRMETFSNQPLNSQSRRIAYQDSDDILWTTLQRANQYRLRTDVELLLHSLVTLRARRRALVEAVLPPVHFIITALLGFCLLLGFAFLVPNPTPASQALFGLVASPLSLCFWLLADLQGEWGGEYRVDDFWMDHTERFLAREQDINELATSNSRKED